MNLPPDPDPVDYPLDVWPYRVVYERVGWEGATAGVASLLMCETYAQAIVWASRLAEQPASEHGRIVNVAIHNRVTGEFDPWPT